ncbi:MAG: hypothetical protein NC200_05780 [Candidatus Gastranaerophilales bacterium]|nr:hypothetical protein [Candidatus Gastranaerophilales bacterium]
MNVQRVNNNPNFGMALHVESTKKIQSILGKKVAQNVEAAKPVLEEMAKDVDIYVQSSSYVHSPILRKDYLSITVQQKNVSFKDKVKSALSLRPPYKVEKFIPASFVFDSTEEIVNETQNAKATLLNYIG